MSLEVAMNQATTETIKKKYKSRLEASSTSW